jgi:hypothetical protein
MKAIFSDAVLRDRSIVDEAEPDRALDAAWLVLDAANDLDDEPTVAACRRVIDAGLDGTPASPFDLHIILNYFR